MFVKMCDNFKELSETYFRFSVALLRAEFGFLTKLNDSTTMKGKCYGFILIFFACLFNSNIYLFSQSGMENIKNIQRKN